MKYFLICFSVLSLFSCVSHKSARTSLSNQSKDIKDRISTLAVNPLITGDIFATVNLFTKEKDGIKIELEVQNVSPGLHGIHIHEMGDCSADDASSAGGHFNPAHLSHGGPNPKAHHMGDLGNIKIDANGRGTLIVTIPKENFNSDFLDWSIIVGKSIILHADPDDLRTNPSGNSGARIACGVIKALDSFDKQ